MNPRETLPSSTFPSVNALLGSRGQRGRERPAPEPAAEAVAAEKQQLRPARPGDKVPFYIVVDGDFESASGPFTFPHAAAVATKYIQANHRMARIVPIVFPDYVQIQDLGPVEPGQPTRDVTNVRGYL